MNTLFRHAAALLGIVACSAVRSEPANSTWVRSSAGTRNIVRSCGPLAAKCDSELVVKAKSECPNERILRGASHANSDWNAGTMAIDLSARAPRSGNCSVGAIGAANGGVRDMAWTIEIPGATPDTISQIKFKITLEGLMSGDPASESSLLSLTVSDSGDADHWGEFYFLNGIAQYSEGNHGGFVSRGITNLGPRSVSFEGIMEIVGSSRVLDINALASSSISYGYDGEHFGKGSASYGVKLDITPPPGAIVTP